MFPISRLGSGVFFTSRAPHLLDSIRSVVFPLLTLLCSCMHPMLTFTVVWLLRVVFLTFVGLTAYITSFQSLQAIVVLSSVISLVWAGYYGAMWFRNRTSYFHKVQADKWEKLIETTNGLRSKIQEMWNVIEDMKSAENNRREVSKSLTKERQMAQVLEENVSKLSDDIQNMKKLKRDLVEEQRKSAATFKKILQENQKLRAQVKDLTNMDYLSDMHQVAQHLQTSLSAAKVKLCKVGDFLKDKHAYFGESDFEKSEI